MASRTAPHGRGQQQKPDRERLLRMGRAPGFGGSGPIAKGKEAASREDQRGIYYVMHYLIGKGGV
ncbi:hypothetical protein B1689_14725 [Geobacillus sp. 44C]|nr:hypothetical protein B1689_14725 [Geobacillus sp. 44C]